jgi:hypothetical protein
MSTSTKTITLPFTFHTRDGAKSTDPEFHDGNLIGGHIVTIEHPPGTPITLPADAADKLLQQFEAHGAAEWDGPGVDIVALANGI